MKFRLSLITLMLLFFTCNVKDKKADLVVYPEYCGGCVTRNFSTIKNNNWGDQFNIYFDSTDAFLLDQSKLNNLQFHHIDNNDIRSKFGDYSNIAIIKQGGEPIELKTNETLEKGKHF